MLRLLNIDKSFIPAKRLFERKPFSEVAYQQEDNVHVMIICNN